MENPCPLDTKCPPVTAYVKEEHDLVNTGRHVLVAHVVKPKAKYVHLAAAAHLAAGCWTGTDLKGCTTDDLTKSIDSLVYYMDPGNHGPG